MRIKQAGQWAIIIDTDCYSGNFERELGAFCTGYRTIRGETFVKDIQAAFKFEPLAYKASWDTHHANPFADLFIEWPGEHGDELAHIHPTPGFWNDGRGTNTKGKPPFHLRDGVDVFPAYQSVIMRCKQEPTAEQVRILTEWIEKFAERTRAPKAKVTNDNQYTLGRFYFKEPMNILGIRVVCNPNDKPEDFSDY